MTESQQTIARAAVAALVDLYERESADLAAVKFLTLEIELKGGKPADARVDRAQREPGPTACGSGTEVTDEVRQPSDGTRPCAHCGQRFYPTAPTVKFCTAMCRLKAKQVRAPRRKQPAPSKEG